MTVVAMDTSALMMPVEAGVRLFDELDRVVGDYDCVVPRAVVEELDSLSQGGGEEATAASVGADLATRCRTVDHEVSYADDALVELGPRFDYVVTNDAPLRERLLDAGVPVIHIRAQNKLAISKP
ncbi:twitching motility protein PilT [halophilic archaeon]|nr:twitching motility protein PilT [halophilic archaeon]